MTDTATRTTPERLALEVPSDVMRQHSITHRQNWGSNGAVQPVCLLVLLRRVVPPSAASRCGRRRSPPAYQEQERREREAAEKDWHARHRRSWPDKLPRACRVSAER